MFRVVQVLFVSSLVVGVEAVILNEEAIAIEKVAIDKHKEATDKEASMVVGSFVSTTTYSADDEVNTGTVVDILPDGRYAVQLDNVDTKIYVHDEDMKLTVENEGDARIHEDQGQVETAGTTSGSVGFPSSSSPSTSTTNRDVRVGDEVKIIKKGHYMENCKGVVRAIDHGFLYRVQVAVCGEIKNWETTTYEPDLQILQRA